VGIGAERLRGGGRFRFPKARSGKAGGGPPFFCSIPGPPGERAGRTGPRRAIFQRGTDRPTTAGRRPSIVDAKQAPGLFFSDRIGAFRKFCSAGALTVRKKDGTTGAIDRRRKQAQRNGEGGGGGGGPHGEVRFERRGDEAQQPGTGGFPFAPGTTRAGTARGERRPGRVGGPGSGESRR